VPVTANLANVLRSVWELGKNYRFGVVLELHKLVKQVGFTFDIFFTVETDRAPSCGRFNE